MLRSSVVICLCIVVFAGLIGFATPAAANPAVYEPAIDPGIGFNLIAWSGNSSANWTSAIDSMYAAGFREVSISPVRRFDYNTGLEITGFGYPSLSTVEAGVTYAKSKPGMRVTLNPFAEFSNLPAQANGWRAYFAPLPGSTVANNFWPAYQSYLNAVATIANNHGVDAMNVGTEMKGLDSFYTITDFDPTVAGNQSATQAQLDQQKGYWNSAINSVRSIYSGQLGYASNWDNFNSSLVNSNIWSNPDINYIGIDSYFTGIVSSAASNSSGTYPNSTFINAMTNGWTNKLQTGANAILNVASTIGKPVVFTESGYLPCNGTGNNPQNSCDNQPAGGDHDIDEFDTGVDSDEQIMAFYGMIRALDGRLANVKAMDIWQWWMVGSSDSLWNIDPPPAPPFDDNPGNPNTFYDQPANVPLGTWLSGFVSNLKPGDFNRDGVVDAADYVVWRKTQGQTVSYFSAADGDGSAIIDAGDYSVWRSYFGVPSGSGAGGIASIPEPTTGWLLIAAICNGFCRKRFRRR